jgi:hypothetical protein
VGRIVADFGILTGECFRPEIAREVDRLVVSIYICFYG